ncbi:MAG: hypothetical protein H0T42_04295 [Deltaproteobacteria bacterium]|nr:hypothetical protein [Deltaproteobacteria bacterium]
MRCFLVLAVIALSPSAGRAENTLFVAGGPLLGASIHDGPNGLLIGGELSAGWLHLSKDTENPPPPFWLGAYADGLYDSGPEAGRVSFGPELGFFIFGLDAGVVHDLGGTGRWGYSGRWSLSIPVSWTDRSKHPKLTTITTLSIYVRGVTWRDGSPGHAELGLLVKWALPALAGG